MYPGGWDILAKKLPKTPTFFAEKAPQAFGLSSSGWAQVKNRAIFCWEGQNSFFFLNFEILDCLVDGLEKKDLTGKKLNFLKKTPKVN